MKLFIIDNPVGRKLCWVIFLALTLAHFLKTENANAAALPDPMTHREVEAGYDPIKGFIAKGKVYMRANYRIENVHDERFNKDATASLGRLDIGYQTPKYKNFDLDLSFQAIKRLGSEHFNDGINGRTQYPLIQDPDGNRLIKANITYTGIKKTDISFGRQQNALNGGRFLGLPQWRMNLPTTDALTIENHSIDNLRFFYTHIFSGQTSRGEKSPNGHYNASHDLLDIAYNFKNLGKLTLYNYMLNFRNNPFFTVQSNKTTGISFDGKIKFDDDFALIYRAEYANQSDYGSAAQNYRADYQHIKLGFDVFNYTLLTGRESLGGNSQRNSAFKTPLAALHDFNGWADIFLNTPIWGLQDDYITLAHKTKTSHKILQNILTIITYHDFRAEEYNNKYGKELDILMNKNITENFSILLKYADYHAKDFGADTRKIWFGLQYLL